MPADTPNREKASYLNLLADRTDEDGAAAEMDDLGDLFDD